VYSSKRQSVTIVIAADEPPASLKHVPLDALHRSLGARMVGFAGYDMPVQYPAGIVTEHLHCRAQAALFDVSHMGQATLSGPPGAAVRALERLVPGELLALKPGRQRYTLLMNEAGGILDDLMVANIDPAGERLFLVVNASRKEADIAHIRAHLPADVTLNTLDDHALLALQGPAAVRVLARMAPAAAAMPFMGVQSLDLGGSPCLVSRSGYTGEDGFEISVPADMAEKLARRLLDEPEVAPAGLGARDSLRLEAGLCLYGNDIDTLTSPVEAGLTWVIGKRRRMAWDFPGAAVVRDQLDNGPTRLRVGLRPDGRAPARAGTSIVAADDVLAGDVTSGGFSPSLGAPIAMGYVKRPFAADGTKLSLLVRGKPLPATVVPLPFVHHRFVR
jgi:aminomethyltransferase